MTTSQEDRVRFANEELLAKGNLAAVEDFFTDDYVAHAGSKKYKGHAFVRSFANQLRSAIHGLRVVKVEFLAKQGATLTWQRTLNGKHENALKGIPPSRRKVTWREMVVTRFKGNKIAEDWVVSELAGELMSKLPRS